MITMEFASSLRRHVDCPRQNVTQGSLRTVLETALADAPELAYYVFDDHGCVRKHVAVFVNEVMVADRQSLALAQGADDRVLVVQALTGSQASQAHRKTHGGAHFPE